MMRTESPAGGVALMRQGIAMFRDLGVGLNLAYFHSLLAEAQIDLGELDEAAASLRLATRAAEQFGEVWWSAETLRLEGVVRRASGDADGAHDAFRGAMGLARSYGSRALEARAGVSLVRLLREQGRDDEADAVRPSIAAARAPAAVG
jgi:tetratricopeptide (TPR) repeat protein